MYDKRGGDRAVSGAAAGIDKARDKGERSRREAPGVAALEAARRNVLRVGLPRPAGPEKRVARLPRAQGNEGTIGLEAMVPEVDAAIGVIWPPGFSAQPATPPPMP